MHIGDVILNLLEQNNMSQRELAEKLKIAATTLNGYIKNKHEPDCLTLVNIAQVFHISVDYLLSYTPETNEIYKNLLTDFQKLNTDQQEIVTDLIACMLKRNELKK